MQLTLEQRRFELQGFTILGFSIVLLMYFPLPYDVFNNIFFFRLLKNTVYNSYDIKNV